MKAEFVRKCTAEENEKLNKYAEMDEPQEWVILKQKNDEYWYTVWDEENECPTDDNIIEGATGELMYLDLDDAKDQWGVPRTLEALTGHESGYESGIVIYPEGETIICHWASAGGDKKGYLPKIFAGGVVGFPSGMEFDQAQEVKLDASELDGIEIIYEENIGDTDAFIAAVKDGEYKAWKLDDGTRIVVCDGWH